MATKPFKDSHFAVFPPELIRPCILAGCPQTVCVKCGHPHVRVVNKVAGESKECPKTQASHEARGGYGKPTGTIGKSGSGRVDGYTETIGWKPTCECNAGTKKGIVLDPFGGSGTTAEVAGEENRDSIVIELNPEYIKLIEKRTSKPVQKKLFE